MCIFTHDVVSVSNTKILVAPLPGGRQVIVYENSAKSDHNNTMILPVPNGQPITLFDVSEKFPEQTLWKECEGFFPQPEGNIGGFAFGGGGGWGIGQEHALLAVQKIGAYHCSIAPSLVDLQRADPTVFSMPKNIEAVLDTHYANGFSFIICKFSNSRISGHPIAYTSARLENGALFIPTRHEHGVEPSTKYVQNVFQNEHVSHQGFFCDVCKNGPIMGSRWQCVRCNGQIIHERKTRTSNYDMCDTCYKNPENKEHRSHPFMEWKMSVEWYNSQKELNQAPTPDLFDHTIFVFNAVLAVGSDRYSKLEEGTLKTGSSWNGFMDKSRDNLIGENLLKGQKILRCQKMSIKGGFLNADYMAFPIQ